MIINLYSDEEQTSGLINEIICRAVTRALIGEPLVPSVGRVYRGGCTGCLKKLNFEIQIICKLLY